MNNVLLVVDTKNIFNSLHRNYGNGKLDYKKFVELSGGLDHLYHSVAYGQQSDNNSVNFITVLNKLGFVCKFRAINKSANGKTYYPNSNMDMVIDIVDMLGKGKIDRVVIGSSDPELTDVVEYVRKFGCQCDIIACRVPKILKDACNSVIELTDDHLLPVLSY